MLTHANLLSVVAGQLGAINQVGGRYGQTFTQDDVMISYLPLAHIFDRCAAMSVPQSNSSPASVLTCRVCFLSSCGSQCMVLVEKDMWAMFHGIMPGRRHFCLLPSLKMVSVSAR